MMLWALSHNIPCKNDGNSKCHFLNHGMIKMVQYSYSIRPAVLRCLLKFDLPEISNQGN